MSCQNNLFTNSVIYLDIWDLLTVINLYIVTFFLCRKSGMSAELTTVVSLKIMK